MADNNKEHLADTNRPVPSQAEGERDGEQTNTQDRPVPSQAEGDLETIEESLNKK